MKRDQLLTRPDEYIPSLQCGIIMAIAVPVLAFLSDIFKHPYQVGVNVWELGEAGMGLSFPYNLEHAMNIIIMCVILNAIFWGTLKALLAKVDARQCWKLFVELCALVVVIISVMGVVFHWGFDRANSLYRNEHGYDTSNVYLYLYFGDEILGHHLQQVALLWYFLFMVILEAKTTRERGMHVDEWIFTIAIATVISVTNGYAALRSESAFLIFVLTVILLPVQAVYVILKRPQLSKSPMLIASMAGNAGVIIQNIAFIMLFGLSPWYPFLRPG